MKKILIANRGEIARRIIVTCKRLNIKTIAIYSEADKEMPFVKEADEAYLIGPSPVQQSYLKMNDIIEIAKKNGADAIHPGYGLLSENAEFARLTEEADIIFIGPDADIIRNMGDKIEARLTMKAAGVPVVPGTDEGVATFVEAIEAATEIGYPVMLKASSGGGGVGMIRCEDEQALSQQFESVKNRAKMYFGNDIVFLEKFITSARHIEVQIFGDKKGNIVHLFERNCSVQRRNQKVIEESPSPDLTESARQQLYVAALDAAKAVNYTNAGTVEFIVDENEHIYFLEMNTRLQVEHPVTEEVTGFDLVEWQIEVARGKELPVTNQNDIKLDGHAIEFRVYAEDPVKFMPSPGTISKLNWGNLEGVRVDDGYALNGQVTPFYDPLISKVIVHGASRGEAIEKAKVFFSDVEVEGIKSNIPLFVNFLEDECFQTGNYTTEILTEWSKKRKEEQLK